MNDSMDRRTLLRSALASSTLFASTGCLSNGTVDTEPPIYTSWMMHPDELPEPPESRYVAISSASMEIISGLVPSQWRMGLPAEGVDGDGYTQILIDTSSKETRSEAYRQGEVSLGILEYSGSRDSIREYIDSYDEEFEVSKVDSYRGYALLKTNRDGDMVSQKSDGGIYLSDGEIIVYEGPDDNINSNTFAETAIDLHEGEVLSYYEASEEFRNLVASAGNKDLNAAAAIPRSEVYELGVNEYAFSHDYVSTEKLGGGFRVSAVLSGNRPNENTIDEYATKELITGPSPLVDNVDIQRLTVSDKGSHTVVTGDIGTAAQAEVLTNTDKTNMTVQVTVVSLGNSDYISVGGSKGATVDGVEISEGEYVYLDGAGQRATLEFGSGDSGELTIIAVIGPEPTGVDNKGIINSDTVDDSSVRTPIEGIQYNFDN